MKNNTLFSLLLVGGILVLINILSNRFFFRLDLTEGKQYTLSNATKDILKGLDAPVTVSAYFSDNLPVDIAKIQQDFQEMLVEYATLSKGNVNYKFINPESDEEQQEAAQNGVQPIMIQVREKDQVKNQQAFLGAVLQMGEQKEVIPLIQGGTGMEYSLSTSIKKLSVQEKPSIGLVSGHGEAGLNELAQAYQSLSILYSIETIQLDADIPDRFRAVAIVAPKDSFPPEHLAKMDDYLQRGGKLLLAINAVNGDLSTAQGSASPTGLEGWLASSKGVEVEPSFLIDAQCSSVTVQQQQGFFTMQTPVQFPYLPLISTFAEHPITKGLEQVILPFASPVRFLGDNSKVFTPIAFSSSQAGIQNAPLFFDIQKQWTAADFPLNNVIVGGVLEGDFGGGTPGKIVIFGDGDFGVSGQQRQGQDNISLLVNSIDWLSDDTGLIELRTKAVATRPIAQEYLGEEASGKRSFIKYLNFGLPIVLILIYGFFRYQQERNKRMRRMESYL
ncbi:MAG: Gldg family protein [Saprospiraceae bacterium]